MVIVKSPEGASSPSSFTDFRPCRALVLSNLLGIINASLRDLLFQLSWGHGDAPRALWIGNMLCLKRALEPCAGCGVWGAQRTIHKSQATCQRMGALSCEWKCCKKQMGVAIRIWSNSVKRFLEHPWTKQRPKPWMMAVYQPMFDHWWEIRHNWRLKSQSTYSNPILTS